MKTLSIKLMIALSVVAYSCRPLNNPCGHDNLVVNNNSSITLYCYWNIFQDVSDTNSANLGIDSRWKGSIILNDSQLYRVEPHRTNTSAVNTGKVKLNCFDQLNKDINGFKIVVFLFDSSVIDTRSWDTVKANSLYVKKLIMDYNDMNAANWQISYP